MKNVYNILILTVLIAAAIFCNSCSNGDGDDGDGGMFSGTYAAFKRMDYGVETYSVIRFINSNTLEYYKTIGAGYVSGRFTTPFPYKQGWYYDVSFGGMAETSTYAVEGDKIVTTNPNILLLTIRNGKFIPDGMDEDHAFVKIENSSDGSADNNPIKALAGTWTGTDSYGMQCKYTFKADGSGTGIMKNSNVTNNWTFTWVLQGNKVKCGGVNRWSGQGESGESYVSTTFVFDGSTLTDESGKTKFKKQ